MSDLRVTSIKLFTSLLRVFKLGSGFTWPGHLLLKIYPQFLNKSLNNFSKGVVYISGTNGKTTTTSYLAGFLLSKGFSVVTNASGANLLNGIASSILDRLPYGTSSKFDYGIFEVDENALSSLLKIKFPNICLLLNLSRDQLDRYGEVDITLLKWAEALNSSLSNSAIYYYQEDPYLKELPALLNNKSITINKILPNKDYQKINKDFSFAVLHDLKVANDSEITNFLESKQSAFGRNENIKVNGKNIKILLAKNPASFNANLDYLNRNKSYAGGTLLFVLNDNIPDGTDVSWIYDIEPNLLMTVCEKAQKIVVSGIRAWDFALRLELSGVSREGITVEEVLKNALEASLTDGNDTVILPTYSAMLETRKELLGRKIL